MTLSAEGELGGSLAPALAALDRMPPEAQAAIREGLESVASVLELASAQADAAEAQSGVARTAADSMMRRADAMAVELDAAVAVELRKWKDVMRFIADEETPATEAHTDALTRMLGVGGPVASSADFDAFMRDPDQPLSLGPKPDVPVVDVATRLSPLAHRADRPPLSEDATRILLARTRDQDAVCNSPLCGVVAWRGAAGGEDVLLGDGKAVSLEGTTPKRVSISESDFSSIRELNVHRWVTGAPPVLLPQARAAYAVCLEARKATLAIDEGFGAWMMFGAAIPVDSEYRPSVLGLARVVREVFTASRSGLPATLMRLVFETMRVAVYPGNAVSANAAAEVDSAIDVGRVRWCELSQQPIVWLPLVGSDPDQIGGVDRPWTLDPPAAGATWHPQSPALRTDPNWHARILVIPGSPNVWGLASDGSWWSFESDFEAILHRRREPVDPWLEALEQFEEDLPARIASMEATAADAEEGSSKDKIIENGARSEADKPAKFSGEWVRDLASRYEYQDDSAAQAAGARAAKRGSYTRDEFLTVVRWKSARSVPLAERNSAESIERQTSLALSSENEAERILSLIALQGVGTPVASALLQFAFPDRYPIIDFRALQTLGDNRRRTQYSVDFWLEYLEKCRGMADEAGVNIRDLDKALWQASREAADKYFSA